MSCESPIRVEHYSPKYKAGWDQFVRRAKNGVFIFHRNYMEYHTDRFSDYSLLFFHEGGLVALMPANRVGDTVTSHGGLTFGGIISGPKMKTGQMLEVFSALVGQLRAEGVKKLVYKAIPHIYHTLPAEEDLYALFLHNAILFRRDVSSTISTAAKLPFTRGRRWALRQAESKGVTVAPSREFGRFMTIVEANLESRHGVLPVHTAAEMQLLADRFPENIKLFTAQLEGEMLGGVIFYESTNVAHGQYRASTEKGRTLGALDCVVEMLATDVYHNKPYIDFGISTTGNGRTLNTGLIQNKESYGARATVHDFYELSLET